MNDIDFAKIIADGRPNQRILAIKVPELCPDCNGNPSWLRDGAHGNLEPCDHPNAPTIGKLLAIGAVVMTAEVTQDYGIDYELGDWVSIDHGDSSTVSAKHLLAALREVQS